MTARGRSVLLSLAALVAAAATGAYVDLIARADPFASLRDKPPGSLNPIDIELRNAELRHWERGKLVASGVVGRVDVRRDHEIFELHDVRDGVYYVDGKSFRYRAKDALWGVNDRTLDASGGVRVAGSRFDLGADGFDYSAATKQLTVLGRVSGRLGDGQATIQNLKIHLPDETCVTGPIAWTGVLDLQGSAPGQSPGTSQDKPRPWSLSSGTGSVIHKNGVSSFSEIRGTDGEISIAAPGGVWDQKTDVVTCSGPVKYWSAKANLVCDHLVIYHREHRLVATGNVVMYVKAEADQKLDAGQAVPPFPYTTPAEIEKSRPPLPVVQDEAGQKTADELRSDDTIRKYPSTVRGDSVEYWYKKGERHAIVTGHAEAQQELPDKAWRIVWAPEGLYDGEKDTLTLLDPAGKVETRWKNSLGDDMYAKSLVTSTKDGDDSYAAEAPHGIMMSEDADLNQAAAQAGPDKKQVKKKKGGTPS